MKRSNSIVKISCTPGSTANFVPVGDSLTLGYPSQVGGYRAPLFAANPGCIMQGRFSTFGLCEGYNGATISTISAAVLPYLPLLLPAPKYILLIAGANDLVAGTTPAATLTLLENFITAMFAAQASISKILVGTTPVGANGFGQSTYDALILGISMTNVITVDVSGTLVYPTDYDDGSHPSIAGYAKMAAQWSPAVAALL